MKRLMLHVWILATPLLSALGMEASAEVPYLWWGEPQAVDVDVITIPSSSGASAAGALGRWWVVYEKGGDIFCADRDTSGGSWRIRRLTLDPALQVNPHIAANGQTVYVVWEDQGGAHPEVWTRRTLGDAWAAAVCLSCDGTPSRRPVIDAIRYYGVDPIVAWEDSTASGSRIIGERYGHSPYLVSSPFASAREPSVCDRPDGGIFSWTDYRHGVPQVYRRLENAPERRVSFLPFPCSRSGIKNGICQEFASGPPLVVFEGDPRENGVSEIFAVPCDAADATMISADDGIPSGDPNLDFIQVGRWPCDQMPGTSATYLVTWTDRLPGEAARHWVDESSCCWTPDGNDLLPAGGLSRSAIATVDGEPHAGVLQLWIEDREGVPTLMARVGHAPGCERPAISGPPALIVGPEGMPSNLVRAHDGCSGEPQEGELYWYLDARLEASLTWDPEQSHVGYQMTNENGEARIGIRAGGCSQAGSFWITACSVNQAIASWPGVKSPDVDGDCEVDLDDLSYVQSKVGTNDFCADLDGSDLVGQEDVAIVQATLGQHCSNAESGVAVDSVALLGTPDLRVFPNPCRTRVTFETIAPWGERPVTIDVLDAGGRRVRTVTTSGGDAKRSVGWDLRDEAGRAMPAGIYFVLARFETGTLRRTLVVTD